MVLELCFLNESCLLQLFKILILKNKAKLLYIEGIQETSSVNLLSKARSKISPYK